MFCTHTQTSNNSRKFCVVVAVLRCQPKKTTDQFHSVIYCVLMISRPLCHMWIFEFGKKFIFDGERRHNHATFPHCWSSNLISMPVLVAQFLARSFGPLSTLFATFNGAETSHSYCECSQWYPTELYFAHYDTHDTRNSMSNFSATQWRLHVVINNHRGSVFTILLLRWVHTSVIIFFVALQTTKCLHRHFQFTRRRKTESSVRQKTDLQMERERKEKQLIV